MMQISKYIEEMNACISSNRDKMISQDGWVDLSSIWSHISSIGDSRDVQKKNYKSSKNWSKHSTHVLGLIGEICFSVYTGIDACLELIPEGDGNIDFIINGKSIDIKTTRYWKDPDLKQYPNPKKWADAYVLCAVDVDEKRAKIFGWTTKEAIVNAKKVDYGYGVQLSMNHSELNKNINELVPNAILG